MNGALVAARGCAVVTVRGVAQLTVGLSRAMEAGTDGAGAGSSTADSQSAGTPAATNAGKCGWISAANGSARL